MFNMIGLFGLVMAATCLCGEAPERANDFFWENDRVGFRAYGPGDVHKWSGIDVFNKSCASNIVVHWLREPGRWGSWHKNNRGLGMDDYAVGPGRGVGGIALRRNGEWLADYGNWFGCRVLESGEGRCAFELDYRCVLGGTMTLKVTLERGSSLFREEVRFSSDTPLEGVEVGAGLDLNAQREHVGDVFTDADRGIVSIFEKPHDRPGEDGAMMSAVMAAPGQRFALVDEPNGAKMVMTLPLRAEDAGRTVLTVYAGADWTGAGRYLSAKSWHDYVRGYLSGVSTSGYLDIMEAAVGAYSDGEMAAYIEEAERDGVQEHGFPRLAANLGVLVANGRFAGKRDLLKRMMDVSCRDAVKGKMPPKSGGNEFSVKELVIAIVALEKSGAYAKVVTDGWREQISKVVAANSYTAANQKIGLTDSGHNWCIFGCASEQIRLMYGLGGETAFIDKYVGDQARWFDENGQWQDPNCPAVYDLVTRLQFASILHDGYRGVHAADLRMKMERGAETALKLLSASGEIPFGGRSNQFLHNNMFYSALCEWYAAEDARRGNLERAGRFRRAAKRSYESLAEWLRLSPVRHVKNRYPRESRFGCENYAYFNKYMITMGSWAMLGWRFADERIAAAPDVAMGEGTFQTTDKFHQLFRWAGEYSMQYDWNACPSYDASGIGRLQRMGAPSMICISVPCARSPHYATKPTAGNAFFDRSAGKGTNETELAIAPIGGAMTSALGYDGLRVMVRGAGDVGLMLPAFSFDGETETRIEHSAHELKVHYRGWVCRYVTDGTIADTGLKAANRNGIYRRFDASAAKALEVRVTIGRE